MTLLFIHELTVVDAAGRQLLDRVSLHVDAGQSLGLAGGPGAGKTVLREILSGARHNGVAIASGRILLGNLDLATEPSPIGGVVAIGGDGERNQEALITVYDSPLAVPTGRPSTETGIIVIDRDPAALAEICDEIAVLCAGRLVERAPSRDLIRSPRHPYTQALLGSNGPGGELGSAHAGCPFGAVCGHAAPTCGQASPDLQMISIEHATACARWRELSPAT